MESDALAIKIQKTQTRFKKVRTPEGDDEGVGEFFLLVDVTAHAHDVYIPTSIASGKKTTGFVYQIEGTAEGLISTTDISCSGEGVTQVTLGTLVYTKIPKGMTGTFRILIEMRGKMQKTYKIVINRIHYKHNPIDPRYLRALQEISTKTLKFQ